MLKDFQITLYDLFGYLLPGGVILLSLAILFWTLFWPNDPFVFWLDLSTPKIVCVLFVAYLAGHVGQAVGNLIEKIPAAHRMLYDHLPISRHLEALVRKAFCSRFGRDAEALEPHELYELCDQTLIHHGSLGEREIFTYREGFYRGNCVALGLLALALFVRLFRTPTKLWVAEGVVYLSQKLLFLAAALASVAAALAFQRYLRFARHRIRSCLLRFLALTTARLGDGKEKA